VCGYGPLSGELEQLSKQHPNIKFDGCLPKQSDCLDWAQKLDVLVNVRLPICGQDNSAPSKIFEYGVAGKAILSTRTAGMDMVLGDEGIYIETENFEESLLQKFREVSAMNRIELERRAAIIRHRILSEYSWSELSRRMVEFYSALVKAKRERDV